MGFGGDSDRDYEKRTVEVRQLPHEFESKLFRKLEEIDKKLRIMEIDDKANKLIEKIYAILWNADLEAASFGVPMQECIDLIKEYKAERIK